MDLRENPPRSKASIDRMGKAIRDGAPYDQDRYTDFILWSVDIIDKAQKLIQASLEISDRSEITIPTAGIRVIEKIPIKLTGRPKTLDTTREKLRRMPGFKLSRIQDICGLRVDGDFSLDQQDQIVDRLKGTFWAAGAHKVEHNDLREVPRYGYRAVHINANFPAARLEVQVRTKLQSAWANHFELVGDIFGRQIRYQSTFEEPIQSLVSSLHSISDSAGRIDQAINQINLALVRIDSAYRTVPEGTVTSKRMRDDFLRTLGDRSLALGNQIDVVDSLDRMRNNLLAERSEK